MAGKVLGIVKAYRRVAVFGLVAGFAIGALVEHQPWRIIPAFASPAERIAALGSTPWVASKSINHQPWVEEDPVTTWLYREGFGDLKGEPLREIYREVLARLDPEDPRRAYAVELLFEPIAEDAEPEVTLTPDFARIRFPQIEERSLTYDDAAVAADRDNNLTRVLSADKDDAAAISGKTLLANGQTNFPGVKLGDYDATGLVGAMVEAYEQHIPLVLRPDDVWLTIVANFAMYVDANGEDFRDQFVAHEGKKTIMIESIMGSGQAASPALVHSALEKLSAATAEHMTQDTVTWLTPSFSTTQRADVITARIAFLKSVSTYFRYLMVYGCGLPEITLQGSVEDWELLYQKATRIADFGGDLEQWSELLLPVLDKFVRARKGEADFQFWQTIATSEPLGSDGSRLYAGWSTVFAPFDDTKLKYRLNSREIVEETGRYAGHSIEARLVLDVEVRLADLETGMKRDAIFYAGPTRRIYDPAENTMRTLTEWAILADPPEVMAASHLPEPESCVAHAESGLMWLVGLFERGDKQTPHLACSTVPSE